jgi:hypothetical protein
VPEATWPPGPAACHQHSTVSSFKSDDTGMRRRAPHRDREITAHTEWRDARCDFGGFTTARSAQRVVEAPGGCSLARLEIVRFKRARKFGRVRLYDEDGAGSLQPGYDGGVGNGRAPFENWRTALCQHARRVDSILDRERNPMERTQ